MLRLLTIALVAVTVAASCSCHAEEVRGAWVEAWSPGYYTADQIDATIAAAKKAGINALYIQVRKNADSYYDSKIEARAPEVAAGFDPLACTIEKAHAQGIQVHAWVNAFRCFGISEHHAPQLAHQPFAIQPLPFSAISRLGASAILSLLPLPHEGLTPRASVCL